LRPPELWLSFVGMIYPIILWLLYAAVLLSFPAQAQSVDSAASPEMARLAKALVGDWNTVEIVQHGKAVPEGAGRHGTVHVRLTGGGTALVSEGHSVGTVGGRPALVHHDLVGSEHEELSVFSLASKRQLMRVANCGAPRIGRATHS
jgi:hypothetical protein